MIYETYEIGERAIYWNPEDSDHLSIVTVISELNWSWYETQRKGELHFGPVYALDAHEGACAPPWNLRKLRPPAKRRVLVEELCT